MNIVKLNMIFGLENSNTFYLSKKEKEYQGRIENI